MRGWLARRAGRLLAAWDDLDLLLWLARRRVEPWGAALAGACAAQGRRSLAHPLAWGSLYAAVLCALGMGGLDRPVAVYFKAHVHGEWEGFFKIVTNLGLAELYLVPAALVLIVCVGAARRAGGQARARWAARAWRAGFLVATMAGSGIANNLIKTAVGRLRPRLWFDQGLSGFHPFSRDWAMNSFPSGHTQAAFAAMTALMVLFPRHAALWLTIAVLVAASRVATTVHWLSDVVAGAWLAIAVTVVLARWWRRRGWI